MTLLKGRIMKKSRINIKEIKNKDSGVILND